MTRMPTMDRDSIELVSRNSSMAAPLPTYPPSCLSHDGQTPQVPGADSEPDSSNALDLDPAVTSTLPNESSLPPVDGGFGAWSFIAAAFCVEAIVWGVPDAFGVFLNAYLSDPKYSSQKNAGTLLPLIGSLSSGIMFFSALVIYPFIGKYPQYKRIVMYLGAVICFGSLLGASYVTKITYLVVLQGVLYAIGGSMLYATCFSYTPEWFVKRRGLANGIIFSGTAVGGIVLPVTLSHLLETRGISGALRILSIAVGALLVPFMPFAKGRLPQAQVTGPGPRSDSTRASWTRNVPFLIFLTVNTLQGFGWFVPLLWLPTFATNLNINVTNASVVLSLLSGASFIGRTGIGLLSDRLDPWMLAFSTLVVTAFSTFVLWGVAAHTYAGLLVFGFTYGVAAGGWPSLWTGFIRAIAKDDHVLTNSLFGYLLCSRGIGNIFSTPISTSLVTGNSSSIVDTVVPPPGGYPRVSTGFQVGEGRFQSVIVYVGSCFAGAAIIAIGGLCMDRWRVMMSGRRGGVGASD